MSELRMDITSGDWIIVAPQRRERPNFLRVKRPVLEDNVAACPFCPGNEAETPLAVFQHPSQQKAWQIRVFPNKFPALSEQPHGSTHGHVHPPELFTREKGFGFHEVIVETPEHDTHLALLSIDELLLLLETFKNRYDQHRMHSRMQFIFLFRNQGPRAGASMPHPHSQFLALPIVPNPMVKRIEIAREFFQKKGRPLYGEILCEEKRIGERVVFETPEFLVFCPYASRTAYETWIFPKKQDPYFWNISHLQIEDLAHVLKKFLGRLNQHLNNPDYNFVIYSAPFNCPGLGEIGSHDFSWHIKVFPRFATFAGFEIGSGITINSLPPETAAQELR